MISTRGSASPPRIAAVISPARDVPLDDALAAEARRQPQRLVETRRAPRTNENPTLEPWQFGFTTTGIAERALDRRPRSPRDPAPTTRRREDAGRSAPPPRGRAPSIDPCSSRARSRVFPSPCRRVPAALEKRLDRAVLPLAPVQRHEDHVRGADRLRVQPRERLAGRKRREIAGRTFADLRRRRLRARTPAGSAGSTA